MRIQITARGTELTEALRQYANQKVGKLEEFFDNIQKVEVVMEATDNKDAEKRQDVELRAWLAGKKVIQAKAAARDVYAAIDLSVEEAKRQIKKHKDMHVDEQRRKSAKAKQAIRQDWAST